MNHPAKIFLRQFHERAFISTPLRGRLNPAFSAAFITSAGWHRSTTPRRLAGYVHNLTLVEYSGDWGDGDCIVRLSLNQFFCDVSRAWWNERCAEKEFRQVPTFQQPYFPRWPEKLLSEITLHISELSSSLNWIVEATELFDADRISEIPALFGEVEFSHYMWTRRADEAHRQRFAAH